MPNRNQSKPPRKVPSLMIDTDDMEQNYETYNQNELNELDDLDNEHIETQ